MIFDHTLITNTHEKQVIEVVHRVHVKLAKLLMKVINENVLLFVSKVIAAFVNY